MFAESAQYYDLIYRFKDYQAEAKSLSQLIHETHPKAQTVLDVACGTGEHHLYLNHFQMTGFDLNPTFIEIATSKNPHFDYHVADMSSFNFNRSFDIITCLFSSIGYVKSIHNLHSTICAFKRHLSDDGYIILEPWITPENWRSDSTHMQTYQSDELNICRMSHSHRKQDISIIDFEYLIAEPSGIQHYSETHELGLFTKDSMLDAFESNGLRTKYVENEIWKRGIYIAQAIK